MTNAAPVLLPLTADNWHLCAALDVSDQQRLWIPSNLRSIAAAQFYPNNVCRAIALSDRVIGFALFGVEQPTGRIKIFRLMIVRHNQGGGYGSTALGLILGKMAQRWPGRPVYVSYQQENARAGRLYQKFDFQVVESAGAKLTACHRS